MRGILVPLVFAATCHGATGMRVLPEPEYGELAVDVVMDVAGRPCTAPRGTTVEVVGTTTSMAPPPGEEMILVRALAGPCMGGRGTVEARLLRDVRATPARGKPEGS